MPGVNINQIIKRIPRGYYFFGIFCLLFTALMVFVEIKNDRFWTNDFKVYFDATKDFIAGNNPYDHAYGLNSGLYKYPPTTLYFFAPSTMFSYFVAQIVHLSLSLLSFFVAVCLMHKMFFYRNSETGNKKRIGLLYLSFVFVAIHFVREFHMGNINMFLLVLFVLGLFSFQRSSIWLQAIFWSFLVILKPIVILAFVPLIFFKHWKTILIMAGIGIIFFLIPLCHLGIEGGILLWKNWLASLDRHGDYIVSENSLKYLSKFYIGFRSEWIPSIIMFLTLIGLMILDLLKTPPRNDKFIEWTIIFLAFTPNFFVTDTEHFLLSLPLILICLKKLIENKNLFQWIIFVLIIIPFSLNSNDLLGKELSGLIIKFGLLGISNLLLIAFFLYLAILFPRRNKKNSAQLI